MKGGEEDEEAEQHVHGPEKRRAMPHPSDAHCPGQERDSEPAPI